MKFIRDLNINDPFDGFEYKSDTCDIVECDGVTVVYDLACQDPHALIERAREIPGRLLVMSIPQMPTEIEWDGESMTLREREKAILENLKKGDVLVICCDREGDLDITLRRVFGICSGYIRGGR